MSTPQWYAIKYYSVLFRSPTNFSLKSEVKYSSAATGQIAMEPCHNDHLGVGLITYT